MDIRNKQRPIISKNNENVQRHNILHANLQLFPEFVVVVIVVLLCSLVDVERGRA
jgi:hypothetical protein